MYTFLPSLLLVQVIAYLASFPHDGESPYALNAVAALAILIQAVMFLHASGLFGNPPTEKYYDATGAITYVSSVLTTIAGRGGFSMLSLRQKFLSGCVLLWCTRLGFFLYSRILRHKGVDFRFTKVKHDFHRFATFWGVQGVWVFITALPVYIINSREDMGPSELTVLDYVGISLWVVGFLLETIADLQKQQWSMIKADKKFIKTGLWSISRHPNYFGEITLWVGIAITTSCSFVYPAQWMALLSPAFVAFLLVHVSGIPLLEKAADEKWEQDEEYRKYKESVPVLIPFVGRKGDAKF